MSFDIQRVMLISHYLLQKGSWYKGVMQQSATISEGVNKRYDTEFKDGSLK
uniref:Uncharacterized protein n=1 Tax=Arundo donax TaxID=35708 RepID=A0A0A9FSM4_ARUDO